MWLFIRILKCNLLLVSVLDFILKFYIESNVSSSKRELYYLRKQRMRLSKRSIPILSAVYSAIRCGVHHTKFPCTPQRSLLYRVVAMCRFNNKNRSIVHQIYDSI